MRQPILLASLLALAACSAAPERVTPQSSAVLTIDAAVEALLDAAALDFLAHRPPEPSLFRAVRAGTLASADGSRQTLICGQFLPLQTDGDAQWTPFATIKTTSYEQWLGDGALALCNNTMVSWQDGDWSTLLREKFDALR